MFPRTRETSHPHNEPDTRPWTGEYQLFSASYGSTTSQDRAWANSAPYPRAFDRVGKDFSN